MAHWWSVGDLNALNQWPPPPLHFLRRSKQIYTLSYFFILQTGRWPSSPDKVEEFDHHAVFSRLLFLSTSELIAEISAPCNREGRSAGSKVQQAVSPTSRSDSVHSLSLSSASSTSGLTSHPITSLQEGTGSPDRLNYGWHVWIDLGLNMRRR